MMTCIDAVVLVLPGYFRVGHWHVPVYGLFAAAGLVLAMWLSQRTARLVGLDVEKFWDAGMFGILAAFVASRVLLVAENWQAFVRFPVMVLALPSLTYGGMVLTALLVFGYLRWKKLPVLRAMDAWAPCAAVLAAVLSVGHFIEGTDAGMSTTLPWGVRTPGDTVLGKTHPVQLYAMLAALAIVELSLIRLKRGSRAGQVAGTALLAGGAISFLLDMLRQPMETNGDAWLDPTQWIALAAVAVGACMMVLLKTAEDSHRLQDVAVSGDVVKEMV
jgi:phosphatidylglycerol:prolipoprotein diacylglycerol transferase